MGIILLYSFGVLEAMVDVGPHSLFFFGFRL